MTNGILGTDAFRIHSIDFAGAGYSIAGNALQFAPTTTDTITMEAAATGTTTISADTSVVFPGIVIAGSNNLVLSGVLTGTGAPPNRPLITVNNTGTTTMSGNQIGVPQPPPDDEAHHGGADITVNAGTLLVTIPGTSNLHSQVNIYGGTVEMDGTANEYTVHVRTGGTLRGTGFAGTILNDALLAPGTGGGIGSLHTSSAGFGATGTLQVRLTSGGSDQLVVDLGGTAGVAGTLSASINYTAALNDQFAVVNAPGGSVTGTFTGLPDGTFISIGGQSFRVNYTASSVLLTRLDPPQTRLNGGPDAASRGFNRLDVVARGFDQQLWHTWYDGGWAGWENLGGQLTADPSTVAWSSNRLDVFGRGTDGQLWHKSWSGSWSGWEPLGGTLVGGPDAAAWAPGRIDVFVRGTDNQLWHRWYTGGVWYGWEPLGGSLASDPTVAAWGPNRLDVFAKDASNQLIHKWWDGFQWNGWETLGGTLNGSPDVAAWSSNRLDVFARDSGNQLIHEWWDGATWNGWESLGATLASDPGVAAWAPNRLDVFAQGTNQQLLHKWWDGASWMGPESLTGPPGG